MAEKWVPVLLGDVRIGDHVRTIPEKIPESSSFREVSGEIVAIRSGGVSVNVEDTWIMFWPDQLERLDRPE